MASTDIQVTFENAAGVPQVIVNQDNSGDVVLTNNAGADIALTGGAPAYPPSSGGAFAIVLDFSALYVDPSDQQNLLLSLDGWTAAFFTGDFPAWVVSPDDNVTWTNGSSFTLSVSNLAPTVPAGTYFLEVDLYNLDANPPLPNSVTMFAVQPASQPTNLNGVVGLSVKDSTVTITKTPAQPIQNMLDLRLANETNSPLVPAGTSWGSSPPTLILSFVPASDPFGYFAMATPAQIAVFDVSLKGGTTGWNITQDTTRNLWKLQPDATTNHEILGTGTEAIAEFSVANILTQFVPGPTLLYVQYINIPGYNDGFFTAVIDKAYAPISMTLSINQTSPFSPQNTSGFLSWDVENALYVELSGVGQVDFVGNNYAVTVTQRQTFLLTAYDPFLGNVVAQSILADFQPELSSLAIPPGVIVAWNGAASSVPANFAVCDGTNGTPDLSDRFIVGAGGTAQPNDNGAPTHTHTLDGFTGTFSTDSQGDHSHDFPPDWFARNLTSGDHGSIDTDGNFPSSYANAGAHTHSATASFPSVVTDVQSGGMDPAWWALLYIMEKSAS